MLQNLISFSYKQSGALHCLNVYLKAGVIIPYDKESANLPIYPIRKKEKKQMEIHSWAKSNKHTD